MLVCYVSYKKCLQNGLSVIRFSHNNPTRNQTLSYLNGLLSHNVVCVVNKTQSHLHVKASDEIKSSHINLLALELDI